MDNASSSFWLYALYFFCIFPLRGDHYTSKMPPRALAYRGDKNWFSGLPSN